MIRRILKWTKRLVLVLLVLALLAFLVFGFLFFWPWEGEIDDVMALVPYDVEFVLRGNYEDFESLDWLDRNVMEDPVHPLVAAWVKGRRRELPANVTSLPALRESLHEIEEQINSQIPLNAEWATFGIEKDILRGESVVAGNFCRGAKPKDGPPSWQEILLLTRVSWRSKFVSGLRHGFIRNNLGPNMQAEELEGGVIRLTFPNMPVRPLRERSTCGEGFVIPPDNIWYLYRVKDVLALSNHESLIMKVAALGEGTAIGTESFLDRPGFSVERSPTGLQAAVDLTPLQKYLIRTTEEYPVIKPVLNLLRPSGLQKLTGGLDFSTYSLIRSEARIEVKASDHQESFDNVYSLSPRPVRKGIADMVPAEDTFAVAFLRTKPQFLFQTIYNELSPEDKRLWQDNLRTLEGGYKSLDDFFREFAGYMGESATVAVGRLTHVFDKTEYTEWYSDELDPFLGVAILAEMHPGITLEETTEFLKSKMPLLGIGENLKLETYKGFTFGWGELKFKVMDYKLLEPCFIAVQGQVIVASNRQYLRQIIDTIKGDAKPLSKNERFRTTMASLPERGQLGAFLDIEKLTRIPKDLNPGSQPRGYLWDNRNKHVRKHHDNTAEINAFRAKLERALPRNPSIAEEDELDERVAQFDEQHRARYSDFVRAYHAKLSELRRFGAFAVVLNAVGNELRLETLVQLREAEDWLEWQR